MSKSATVAANLTISSLNATKTFSVVIGSRPNQSYLSKGSPTESLAKKRIRVRRCVGHWSSNSSLRKQVLISDTLLSVWTAMSLFLRALFFITDGQSITSSLNVFRMSDSIAANTWLNLAGSRAIVAIANCVSNYRNHREKLFFQKNGGLIDTWETSLGSEGGMPTKNYGTIKCTHWLLNRPVIKKV